MNILWLFTSFFIATISTKDIEPNAPKEFVAGYLDFSTRILEAIYKARKGNFFICLLSPVLLFSALRNGAKGKTYEEITSTLQLDDQAYDINTIAKRLISDISPYAQGNRDYFVTKDVQVDDHFKQILETYSSKVTSFDFSDTNAAAARINYHASAGTNDIIQNIVHPSDLHKDMKIVTVSALSFQAKFADGPFDPSLTTTGDFYKTKHDTTQVEYITKTAVFNYYEDPVVKVIEIPLEGQGICIILGMSSEIRDLSKVEPHTKKLISMGLESFKKKLVQVTIPKFEFASSWDQGRLKDEMPSVFTSKGDFSGIGGDPKDLFISLSRQKSYVRLSEAGLEQPDVSGKGFIGGDSRTGEASVEFKIDHPFYFLLSQDYIVHYAGRVIDPNEDVKQ